jgi:nickel-dependent lactate racemase
MVEIWFPYGSSEVPLRVPDENLIDILKPQDSKQSQSETNLGQLITEDIVAEAKHTDQICVVIGSSKTRELLVNTTRSLLNTLVGAGVSRSKITILTTPASNSMDELTELQMVQHSPSASPTAICEGFSGDFAPLLNTAIINSEFTIAIGELMPHHLTGYTGLCDLIFPGMASEKSAREELIRNKPMAPRELHTERLAVTSLLRNVYALGYVLNGDLSVADASFGPFNDTIKRLSEVVNDVAKVEAKRAADIVIMSAGGMPLDETLLRAVESFPAGLSILKRNGALIVAAECTLGHGDFDFFDWSNEHKEPRYLEARLRRRFNYYGWKAAYLMRTLANHRIYLVSTIPDHHVEHTFGLRAAKTMNAALQSAQRAMGADASITVIPNASQVIPHLSPGTTQMAQQVNTQS